MIQPSKAKPIVRQTWKRVNATYRCKPLVRRGVPAVAIHEMDSLSGMTEST